MKRRPSATRRAARAARGRSSTRASSSRTWGTGRVRRVGSRARRAMSRRQRSCSGRTAARSLSRGPWAASSRTFAFLSLACTTPTTRSPRSRPLVRSTRLAEATSVANFVRFRAFDTLGHKGGPCARPGETAGFNAAIGSLLGPAASRGLARERPRRRRARCLWIWDADFEALAPSVEHASHRLRGRTSPALQNAGLASQG